MKKKNKDIEDILETNDSLLTEEELGLMDEEEDLIEFGQNLMNLAGMLGDIKDENVMVKCPNCDALVSTDFRFAVECPGCYYSITIDQDTVINEQTQEIISAMFEKEALARRGMLKLN